VVLLKILVASHGTFASGIKSSLEVLLGKSDTLSVIDAYIDQNDFETQLEVFFQTITEGEQVILLSDLYGGSVNQKLALYLTRPETYLIAGVNLPLLLALMLNNEPVDEEKIKALVKESREAIRIVEIQSNGVENEDFFGGS
jgi:mannose/fructose-specific phosphotransferase system component IIA